MRSPVPFIYSSAALDLVSRHSPRQHPGTLLPFFRRLVSAFETRRELALKNPRRRMSRTFYPVASDRDPLAVVIGQLRYAVHTLGFDESRSLQKQCALYLG